MHPDNDFDIAVTTVDQDTADQRITDPVQHDEDLYKAQLENEALVVDESS